MIARRLRSPTPQLQPAAPQEVSALVARAVEGDVAAFERLVAEFQGKVYGFALTFTPDRDEAADLAQEALVKVYRAIGSFRFQCAFSTWLFQIVKNTFLDAAKSRAWRERALAAPIEEGGELAESAMAEEGLLREEDRRALARALERVPMRYRMVVVMFDVQGFSYDEIAQILDVPVGTVKSRLKRGRDALREAIFRSGGREA
jgi:RNA polymerase sigma-70 factor (ECF subfamily)